MNYLEFVEKIKSIPSSYEAYKDLGASDDFIRSFIKSYVGIPKKNARIKDDDDEVIKLINGFDLSKLNISEVSFLTKPIITREVIFFGKVEFDRIGIYKPNGEIRCYEDQSEHLTLKCAKNGSMFLDALFEAGYFLEKRSFHDNLINDEELSEKMAEYCAEIAGGMQYKDFYWMICC